MRPLLRTPVVAGFLMLVAGSLLAILDQSWPAVAAATSALALAALVLAWWTETRRARLQARWAPLHRQLRALTQRATVAENAARTAEAAMERLPDPLILLGADRQVQRANASARAAFGTDLAAVLRQPSLIAALDRSLATGRAHSAELALTAPVPRDILATVIALSGQDGAPGGPMPPNLAVVLSDRTRERAVERMRADFVANASHELRTPLTSLIGFIETLQGPARTDEPARDRFLAIMAEQAARMNRLIDDLLSLSRIELTEHRPPDGQVDLAALSQRLAASFEPRLAARRIRLHLVLEPALPPVVGDADQLAQVLQNLLDNGVKYGRDGGLLRLSVQRPDAIAGRWPARPGVLLSVTDDGHGIPRADLPRLTERFYRVDKGRSRAVGGTGLGLAIVKHIVNRHRGQMAIASEEGAGTTVTIWLPAAAAPSSGRLPAPT